MSKTRNRLVANWTRRAFVRNSTTAFASLLLPMGFSQRAFAQTAFDFYISPTGSDNNPGTLSSPWAITALNTKRAIYAGRRVGLLDGTYSTAGMPAYSGSNSPSLGIAGGSSVSPTVIQAVNPRMAIIDGGGSTSRAAIGSFDSSTRFITIKDLVVRNNTAGGIHIQGPSGQAAGIRIEGCDIGNQVYNVGDITSGIFLQSCDDAVISNNYLHDIRNTAQSASVASIVMYGCRRTEIVENTFTSVHAAIYDKYAGGTQGSRIDMQETRVRRNYFLACPVACLGFDNKDQTGTPPSSPPYGPYIIENNVFENCGAALTNLGAFSAASPVIFRNNTLYATSGTAQGPNLHTLSQGCEPSFYNNVWYFSSNARWGEYRALVVSVSGGGSALANVIDYNCYGPGAVQWLTQTGYGYPYSRSGGYATHSTAAAWQNATGGDRAGRSLFAVDPRFSMAGSGAEKFQLASGSPCLNAGRAGGVSSGASCHMGAWDGRVTRIGCQRGSGGVPPKAPVMMPIG
jgi:hypothetical protein